MLEIYKTDFKTFKQGEWKGTILKNLSRQQVANLLMAAAANEELPNISAVPSSDYTRVVAVNIDGFDKILYFKKYLYRSNIDFLKHIFRPSRAKRALSASTMLRQNGFCAPRVIGTFEKTTGYFTTQMFLITEEAENNGSFVQYWQNHIVPNRDLSRKKRFIESFAKIIGKLHSDGIFHGDLRLNNVLVREKDAGWEFCFIDNERTKKFNTIPNRMRLKNLVQINMFCCSTSKTDQMRFFEAYSNAAKLEKRAAKHIAKAVLKNMLRRLKRRANDRTGTPDASLQTQWAFQRACLGRIYGIFLAEFCRGNTATDFLRQIEHLMEAGVVLKDDVATRIARCTYNQWDIVIKRYNHQSLWHSLRHTVKSSRARRCWRFGIVLAGYRIPCAKPLAMVEERRFGLVWQSYIANAFVEGPTLYTVVNTPGYSEQARKKVIEKAELLLQQLALHRLTHSDTKPSNMVVFEGQPVLVDLDSMHQHRIRFYFQFRCRKMIDSFHRRLQGKK